MGTETGKKPWNESYLKVTIPLYVPFFPSSLNPLIYRTCIYIIQREGKGQGLGKVFGKKLGKKTMKREH